MKIMVLGCGLTGALLARDLDSQGHTVTVVDRDRASFLRLGDGFGGQVIVGTCIDQDILRRAGATDADAVLVVTGSDQTNLMAAQLVTKGFRAKKVVVRVKDPEYRWAYQDGGFEIICPTAVTADLCLANLKGD